jgi:hypothetical protein
MSSPNFNDQILAIVNDESKIHELELVQMQKFVNGSCACIRNIIKPKAKIIIKHVSAVLRGIKTDYKDNSKDWKKATSLFASLSLQEGMIKSEIKFTFNNSDKHCHVQVTISESITNSKLPLNQINDKVIEEYLRKFLLDVVQNR